MIQAGRRRAASTRARSRARLASSAQRDSSARIVSRFGPPAAAGASPGTASTGKTTRPSKKVRFGSGETSKRTLPAGSIATAPWSGPWAQARSALGRDRLGEAQARRHRADRAVPVGPHELVVERRDRGAPLHGAGKGIGEREGAALVFRAVVPGDAHAGLAALDAKGPRLLVGARGVGVRHSGLGDLDRLDLFAGTQRDLAVREAEAAAKGVDQRLGDRDAAVRQDQRVDLHLRHAVALVGPGGRRPAGQHGRGQRQPEQPSSHRKPRVRGTRPSEDLAIGALAEADDQRPSNLDGRRAQVAGRPEQHGEQLVVRRAVLAQVEDDDLRAARGDDPVGAAGQRERVLRAQPDLRGVDLLPDLDAARLKEPLSLLAAASPLAPVVPVDRAGHGRPLPR